MLPEPIIVEQEFVVPPILLWQAITDVRQMQQWYFPQLPAFEAEVGFSTRFDVEFEGQVYPHAWHITQVQPLEKLVYDWHCPGFVGKSFITWHIEATPSGSKLTLTHVVTESFPQDDPVFSRESGVEGWNMLIRQNLKEFVEKQQ